MPKVEKIDTRKTYEVSEGNILIFGDLHLSCTYEGSHKNYAHECYSNMEMIYDICVEKSPRAIIFLGDIIGVRERNLRDHQFLMQVVMFFTKLNNLTYGQVFTVKGNHDIGDFADFDFLVGLGLLKNPKYIDYCRKDGTIEVRFHFLNYGEERRSLDLASELDGSTASDVALGHADFFIEGVTNWYSARSGVEVNSLDNLQGVDMLISGHIHEPSDEILYTTLTNGQTIGLFYTGSPSRVAERIDSCWYMWFRYTDGETQYDAVKMKMELPASEAFYAEEELIGDEEGDERVYQSEKLSEYAKEIIESRLTTGNLFDQIDKVPGASKDVKELAKSYLRMAIDEGN